MSWVTELYVAISCDANFAESYDIHRFYREPNYLVNILFPEGSIETPGLPKVG